jgi:hypothetical protein
MEEATTRLQTLVERSARRGASAVTRDRQLIADAVTFALERWEDAALAGKHVANWSAWAQRIGANAARRLSGRRSRRAASHEPNVVSGEAGVRSTAEQRAHLRAGLSVLGGLLRGRQRQVLEKLIEPDMTFHRAARELGMERHAVRRSFHSGAARLGSLLRNYPPPLLSVREPSMPGIGPSGTLLFQSAGRENRRPWC